MRLRNTVLHQKCRVQFISSFSSGSQVSGTRIVIANEISHAFRNLQTPYAELSVAPLNGKQLRPLVCFVPLFGPLSEQGCIIQCSHGAIHVSVASNCSEFRRLPPSCTFTSLLSRSHSNGSLFFLSVLIPCA